MILFGDGRDSLMPILEASTDVYNKEIINISSHINKKTKNEWDNIYDNLITN